MFVAHAQEEIANVMAENGYVFNTTPERLVETFGESDLSLLKPFPPPQTHAFATFVDGVFGF